MGIRLKSPMEREQTRSERQTGNTSLKSHKYSGGQGYNCCFKLDAKNLLFFADKWSILSDAQKEE
jgi:hypothetical protein